MRDAKTNAGPKLVLCGECVFWRAVGESPDAGRCWRHAPQPLIWLGKQKETPELKALWPETGREGGCGEGKKA